MRDSNAQLGETNAETASKNPLTRHRLAHPRLVWLKVCLLLVVGLGLVTAPISPAPAIVIWAVALTAADLVVMMIFWRPLLHHGRQLTASAHQQLDQLNETSTRLDEIITRLRSAMEEMRHHPELALAARYALEELDTLDTERRDDQRNNSYLN